MFKEGTILTCVQSGTFFILGDENNWWIAKENDLLLAIKVRKSRCVWNHGVAFYVLHPEHGIGHAHFKDQDEVEHYLREIK